MRNVTYGLATPWLRQRYRCQPLGGAKRHSFTRPLPRDHVHLGEEHCESCDEIAGIHRGETAAARRYSWSKRIVAWGLEMMSRGTVYADVGRWALRVTNTERSNARQAPKPSKKPGTRATKKSGALSAVSCVLACGYPMRSTPTEGQCR